MEPNNRQTSPYEAIKSDIASLKGKLEAILQETDLMPPTPSEVTKKKMTKLGIEEVLTQLSYVKEQVDSLSRL